MNAPHALGSDVVELDALAVAFRSAARTVAALSSIIRSSSPHRLDRTGCGSACSVRWPQPIGNVVTCSSPWSAAPHGSTGAAQRQRAASAATASGADPEPLVTVLLSTAADGGRLVQRVGAPDAVVLVIVVPGVGTDPGDRDRLRSDAVRLWRALTAQADDPDAVAVVSWLGYDPPDVVVGAVDPRPADEGAAGTAAGGHRSPTPRCSTGHGGRAQLRRRGGRARRGPGPGSRRAGAAGRARSRRAGGDVGHRPRPASRTSRCARTTTPSAGCRRWPDRCTARTRSVGWRPCRRPGTATVPTSATGCCSGRSPGSRSGRAAVPIDGSRAGSVNRYRHADGHHRGHTGRHRRGRHGQPAGQRADGRRLVRVGRPGHRCGP